MTANNGNNGSPLTIIVIALVALGVLSILPWGDVTGHKLKSFSLVSDLFPSSDKTYITHEEVDPALASLEFEPAEDAAADTTMTQAGAETPLQEIPDDFTAPTDAEGNVLIEDYGSNLPKLRATLAEASSRAVRIAVLGDSYIEGDIFTQDVRSMLQEQYGGRGVGYIAAYSAFPGFRQSVRQSGSGWTEKDMRKIGQDPVKPLQGVYHEGTPGAKATYKGASRIPHTAEWTRSRLMYIAPAAGHLSVKLSGDDTERSYDVTASQDVQTITVDAPTTEFSFTSDVPGLKVLGVWLETPRGIVLDCMSMRGNSGISHRELNPDISAQLRAEVPYDVIVLEFGINALTSTQTDYGYYTNAMVQAVNKVKASYPGATILIMGIGDRGQKQGTVVQSMATAPAMVKAQRDIARRTGSLFWDTRAAMGGEGAAVEWHKRGHVNADYIHLNHKGGHALAEIFVNSLKSSISE